MTLYRLDNHRPQLPPDGTYWIAPDAVVVGQVRIGRDVSIWFGATVRGDNEPIEIGAASNIQEKVTLHVDPGLPLSIGAGCTVGHNAVVHGCTIGDNSLIGIGATVLNGARIGANCLVGANALVTEGKSFPDGSLIMGAPAKVARELSDSEVEGLRASARNYVERWRRYARGLNRLED